MIPNRLAHEKSPYLLQHRENPVDWYPWGDAAFAAAWTQQKPIFLSIGYSTCHWCHVMAHDSFEDNDVARYLNDHFISIKLDREERPDVDQIYMDVVVALHGHGGWPLSVFLTPDRKPFFGGTFFWRADFLQLLRAIHEQWQTDSQKIHAQSAYLTDALQQHMARARASGHIQQSLLDASGRQFADHFDAQHGGFSGAPKFPPSVGLQFLLRMHHRTRDAATLHMVTTTLDHMARGGLYDHLGGGFARYSTDAQWLVPHFEKMLYDNALLVMTYLEAYQVTSKPMYAAVARETLDYVLRVMTHPDGGFYSAEDADSEEEEGKFYVWTHDELRRNLTTDEFAYFANVYGVTADGNFEHHTNILHLTTDDWDVKSDARLVSAHHKLLAIREQRVHPHTDDKILTAWNGLMMLAMANGYQVLGDERYLVAAQRCAHFLQMQLMRDNRLLRRYREGVAGIDGFLEDYAYLISGLLALYQSDFDRRWLDWAEQLQHTQDELLWDATESGYFFSAARDDLIIRTKEFHDGAIPSANSVAIENLLRLYARTARVAYRERAEQLLTLIAGDVVKTPLAYAQALIAMDWWLTGATTVAVVGYADDSVAIQIRRYCYEHFLPHALLAIGATNSTSLLKDRPAIDGKTTIYLCEGDLCHAPTADVDVARRLLTEHVLDQN